MYNTIALNILKASKNATKTVFEAVHANQEAAFQAIEKTLTSEPKTFLQDVLDAGKVYMEETARITQNLMKTQKNIFEENIKKA